LGREYAAATSAGAHFETFYCNPAWNGGGLNEAARSETIDELFALTSLSLFAELQRSGRSNAKIELMILRICGQVWEGRMNTTSIALPT